MPVRTVSLLVSLLLISISNASASDSVTHTAKETFVDVANTQWMHGASKCKNDVNPPIQVVQADESSYVLRQNKCVTFEAPFIYVLFGRDIVLVLDTGANASPVESPIYQTIESLLSQQRRVLASPIPKLLVVHSHSHNDHTKGDFQFEGKPGVEIVATNNKALETQLGLSDWPNRNSSIDLGDRVVTIIPTPGHQEQSIAIYDHQTKWLMTGDTLYPGAIRVKNWSDFRNSIKRLLEFSQTNPVSHIMGAHIELNRQTGELYRIGSTYQPHEAPLGLDIEQLAHLNNNLQRTSKAKKLVFESFTISPLSRFEKFLSRALSKRDRQQ